MSRSIKAALVALVITLTAGACRNEGSAGAEDGQIQAVATYSILGDMVENVAGDGVELTTMVGPEQDAHTFESSPSDSRTLAEADLIFENGLEFEPWLGELYGSSGSEARRITVSRNVETLDGEGHEGEGHEGAGHEDEGAHEEEEGAHEEHQHSEVDPHVWQDPNNAIQMVEAIQNALSEVDPENEESYRQNASEYIGQLEDLDGYITEQVGAVPEEDRKLVTGHRVFAYFAEQYGFEVPGAAIPATSTETSDPSARQIAELSDKIRAENVPAIFPEMFTTDGRLMERLANEADVELAPPLFTGALAEEGNPGDTYLGMMRYNAETISNALAKE